QVELAQVMVDDAEHVVHVGVRGAACDHLLQVPCREGIIAPVEVLFAEGDQLPHLVVHASERSTNYLSDCPGGVGRGGRSAGGGCSEVDGAGGLPGAAGGCCCGGAGEGRA